MAQAARNPYDVHFYFTQADTDSALSIRTSMKERFPELRFFEPHHQPIGPHPVPMWEADFFNLKDQPEKVKPYLSEVIEWLKLNRGSHNVLIHPHTSEGAKADHTKNAIWIGEPVPLLLNTFSN